MVSPSESLLFGGHRYAAGDIVAAKYRLERPLGEGGMGTVWQALNLQLEAPVALKLIRAELDRDLLKQRLKQEARAAAKLGHPAMVRVFDVGESEFGDPFIVMELLNGQSLAALLLTERRLAATRALQLLLPVADALSAAHAKGIIHRDLKPDNVFIALEDERVQPKLVDFGIVKLSDHVQVDKHLTQAGTVLGSPEYMSPEQARGREDIDHRTDIWSFAVVLYETLAGATPFAGTSYNALLRSIVEDEPPSLLNQLASDEPLWEIIRRGLAKDVAQRFRSMNEFGRALAGWLLAQGVFEDVAGGSLEAKWLMRNSDPFAPRVSRASFSSINGQAPESGVRVVRGQMASAPTLGLPAAPDPKASTNPAAASAHPRRLLRALVGLAVFLVLALTITLLVRRGTSGPTPAQPAPSVALAEPRSRPQAQATTEPAPSPVVAPQPSAMHASDSPVPQAPASAPRSRNGHPSPLHPRAVPSPAPRPIPKSGPADSNGDLLTPY